MAHRQEHALLALGDQMQKFMEIVGAHAAQTAERSEADLRGLADAVASSVTDALAEIRSDREKSDAALVELTARMISLESAIRAPRRKTIIRNADGDAVGVEDVAG